jgi:hypothetical protein
MVGVTEFEHLVDSDGSMVDRLASDLNYSSLLQMDVRLEVLG